MNIVITSHNLISWRRWAAQGETEEERAGRAERVERFVFPSTLTDEEKARRKKLVEYVKSIGDPPSWEGWPEAVEVPDDGITLPAVPIVVPPAPPMEWEGLISPKSPAYMRGSKHDGTEAEVGRMRREARGTPFFDVDEEDEVDQQRRESTTSRSKK